MKTFVYYIFFNWSKNNGILGNKMDFFKRRYKTQTNDPSSCNRDTNDMLVTGQQSFINKSLKLRIEDL